ncbi:MAG: hypothetical protein JSR18_12365 [Proteobacteria bacterium]|nr:hypothetical protein [Pseudomonadota bacterium]
MGYRHVRNFRIAHSAAVAAAAACTTIAFSTPARAQDTMADPGWQGGASVVGLAETRTDFDGSDGHFSVNRGWAIGTLSRSLGGGVDMGLSLRYGYADFDFSTPNALGAAAPWGSIVTPSVGLNLRYRLSQTDLLFGSAQWGASYESGASASRGQTYGGIVGASRFFSPTAMLGIGAGVFRDVNRTRIIPVVLVNWQIDPHWYVANPLEAGPAGGAGLELGYKFNDTWSLALAAGVRNTRFRLDADGPVPSGIGQESGVPVFAELTYKLGKNGSIVGYAGVVAAGNLRVMNSDGATLSSSDYDAAPIVGMSASIRF